MYNRSNFLKFVGHDTIKRAAQKSTERYILFDHADLNSSIMIVINLLFKLEYLSTFIFKSVKAYKHIMLKNFKCVTLQYKNSIIVDLVRVYLEIHICRFSN